MDVETNPGPGVEQQHADPMQQWCLRMEQRFQEMLNGMHNLSKGINQNVDEKFGRLEFALEQLFSDMDLLKIDTHENREDIQELRQDRDDILWRLDNLEKELDTLEMTSRRCNLKFTGVEEHRIENYRKSAERIIDILNKFSSSKTWHDEDIERAHRIGDSRRRSSQPRPLIVRFHRWSDKMIILNDSSLRDRLRREGIKVSADLTTRQREEIQYHRSNGKIAYFKNGRLRVEDRIAPRTRVHQNDYNYRQSHNPDEFEEEEEQEDLYSTNRRSASRWKQTSHDHDGRYSSGSKRDGARDDRRWNDSRHRSSNRTNDRSDVRRDADINTSRKYIYGSDRNSRQRVDDTRHRSKDSHCQLNDRADDNEQTCSEETSSNYPTGSQVPGERSGGAEFQGHRRHVFLKTKRQTDSGSVSYRDDRPYIVVPGTMSYSDAVQSIPPPILPPVPLFAPPFPPPLPPFAPPMASYPPGTVYISKHSENSADAEHTRRSSDTANTSDSNTNNRNVTATGPANREDCAGRTSDDNDRLSDNVNNNTSDVTPPAAASDDVDLSQNSERPRSPCTPPSCHQEQVTARDIEDTEDIYDDCRSDVMQDPPPSSLPPFNDVCDTQPAPRNDNSDNDVVSDSTEHQSSTAMNDCIAPPSADTEKGNEQSRNVNNDNSGQSTVSAPVGDSPAPGGSDSVNTVRHVQTDNPSASGIAPARGRTVTRSQSVSVDRCDSKQSRIPSEWVETPREKRQRSKTASTVQNKKSGQ